MELLAKYWFVIVYKSGTSNNISDILSRFNHRDRRDEGEEGKLALAVKCRQKEVEPFTEAVKTFLSGGTLGSTDGDLYWSVCGGAKNFTV